ncbi:HAD-IIB family hydrolase [Methylophaga sp. OBS4]|uniref:HAD-IIB family hydrolase n=1 Tax=Methylophaga sp. OBS4 TaxID=2991935 RepID=UPI0022541465|nr:HAD-IIB family hydrolase [Methylophaga sp. OBS4]MCX4186460.1 HAD-IIB family hydrolase [Methylophaga sp. OBS4]
MDMLDIDISRFLKQQQLPDSYCQLTERWFAALAEDIAAHQKSANRPLVIGINGAQGSGKSTLAQLLVFLLQQQYQLKALSLSLDDFYFSRSERETLAQGIHPLLATRGAPGTHDIALARKTISDLIQQRLPVTIPRFNKATDDRFPQQDFDRMEHAVDIVVLEGWCLGAQPQSEQELAVAVNDLEANEDQDRHWRRYVNEQLALFYPKLFELIDIWVMLKAPSFDCVFRWRAEQENKLRQSQITQPDPATKQLMDDAAIARFIKFYQRITEHTLKTLPAKVHYLFELDAQRNIIKLQQHDLKLASRNQEKKWLIFTDMDGSLLDHYSYRFDEAVPTLELLEKNHIPLIPVSSKTQAELELLRNNLNNAHPFIVENGAAVFIPVGYFDKQPAGTIEKGTFWVKEFVEPRKKWQALIAELRPQYNDQFITFADAGIDGIIAMTGLNVHTAARAARRQYGEPVSWLGNGNLRQQFIRELIQRGAFVLEGGRFLHVSGDCDKGRALQWLADVYQQFSPAHTVVTLAIGDSPNDKAMLEQADYALLVRSPVHALPEIERDNNLYVSTRTGPKGWAEGVTQILGAMLHSNSSTLPRGHHG